MSVYEIIGSGVYVHPNVKIGKNVKIGHCSCIGYGEEGDGEIFIGDNVTIGAFCTIYFGSEIKEEVLIEDYCKIGAGAKIGRCTKILYGKHVYDDVSVGEHCIIGGHIADRTVIENNVTYLGEIAHSHRNASLDWDETEEKSPIIRAGSIIGVNALIIGGLEIGPCAYIGAGEILRTNVGENMAFMKNKIQPLSDFRGMFKSRCNE